MSSAPAKPVDFRSSNGLLGLWLAVILAIVYITYLFPKGFISGQGLYWQAQNEDISQYLSGFWFFIQEAWGQPLLHIQSLNWPSGTLATFVDIIPIYSSALKAIYTAIGPESYLPLNNLINPLFNPFGYWVGLCLILQAISAWWLLKEAQIACWYSLVCLTLLLLTFPLWLMRMGHISLLSQWLILFAFALVLRGWRTLNFPALAWSVLILGSFFINIYLCTMVCLICASQWPAYLGRQTYKTLLFWALATTAVFTAVVWLTMWPLPSNNAQIEPGFGIYSLNLLSPMSGGLFLDKWFNFASPEQAFEGFNYWGLGVILLITIALVKTIISLIPSRRYSAWIADSFAKLIANPFTNSFAKPFFSKFFFGKFNHLGCDQDPNSHTSSTTNNVFEQKPNIKGAQILLLALFFLVTFYALSNQIYVGKTLIYQWEVPTFLKPITGQLRASGRFFWIVSYGLLIWSFIVVSRAFSSRTKKVLLCAALSLQIVDVWPYLSKMQRLNDHVPPPLLNTSQWQQSLAPSVTTLYFFPKFKCATHTTALETLLPVQLFAAKTRRQLNTAYIARYSPQCSEELQEIASSNRANSAYIFVNKEYAKKQIEQFFPSHWTASCQTQDFATLCTAAPRAALQ